MNKILYLIPTLIALISCEVRTSQSNELPSKIYYDEDSCLGGDYELRKVHNLIEKFMHN